MRGKHRLFGARFWSAGALLAACSVLPVFGQTSQGQSTKPKIAGNFDQVHVLPPGDPAPRGEDGHVDLTGRYYPNHAGRMLEGGYRLPRPIMQQYDPAVTPQENPVFKPDAIEKFKEATPYGSCPPGGTPTSITTQATEHGPMELVQKPGVLWVLSEFPQTIRRIPTDGSAHPKDPDPTFNGDSRAHWEGDTLVVDTIAIDTRMRNISVGLPGDANAWLHSDQEHVIERFSRPSKNYVMYQVHVEDPVVLVKPFTSAPLAWTLAQDPKDVWTEYICTENEDPETYKNMNQKEKDNYEKSGKSQKGAPIGLP
jgi:hypothetical protein